MKCLSVVAVVFLTACASSPYHYKDQATALKPGVSKYSIENIDFSLENNRKPWTSDETVASYPDEGTVKSIVQEELVKSLKSKNIYVEEKGTPDAKLDIKISYRRSFVVGSGVTYPYVSYAISGKDKDGTELVSFESGEGMLKGGGRKSIWNDQKIVIGKYKVEDERSDIVSLSNLIQETIANIGK